MLGETAYLAINGGGHTLSASDGSGFLCEVVLTLVLVMTVLMAAVDTDGKNPGAPFAIGFAVFVDILAAYVLTSLTKFQITWE